jgi:hypothetical protein
MGSESVHQVPLVESVTEMTHDSAHDEQGRDLENPCRAATLPLDDQAQSIAINSVTSPHIRDEWRAALGANVCGDAAQAVAADWAGLCDSSCSATDLPQSKPTRPEAEEHPNHHPRA